MEGGFSRSYSLPDASVVWGDSRPDLLRAEVLADIFESTARRCPSRPALIFGQEVLTYQELNSRSEIAANRLLDSGVRTGDIVGLWMDRGIELLVLQLAVAKSGAAWLPLDAQTPASRVVDCLQDAKAVGLISSGLLNDSSPPWMMPCRVWDPKELLGSTRTQEDPQDRYQDLPKWPSHLRRNVQPSDPAYVIYTSGSTGKPKGIVVSQQSICHFLRAENDVLGVCSDDKVYQGFSVAFDMSFEEIWISYLAGASLWIAPGETAIDLHRVQDALATHRLTVLHTVPSAAALLDASLPHLRLLNLGGEPCTESVAERWITPERRVYNSYGPTEAAVSTSMIELRGQQQITIGRPLANVAMLVLPQESNSSSQPVRVGEVGELCLAGPGLALGYLNQPELTMRKFSFRPDLIPVGDQRIYFTGDLARMRPDGQVECLGRTDDQIKIRGYRVELGDIESVLSKMPGVGAACVVLRESHSGPALVGFVQAIPRQNLACQEIRLAMAQSLPGYMIPSRIEVVDELPRLVSGKVDRAQLRVIALDAVSLTEDESEPPQGDAERVLFEEVARLLPGRALKRHSDFFDELGGHSLLAARLVSALRQRPEFVHASVTSIYRARTLEKIAAEFSGLSQQSRVDSQPRRLIHSAARRWACGVAQGLVLPFIIVLRMAPWLAPFFCYHYLTGEPEDSDFLAVVAAIVTFAIATGLQFLAVWAIKRLTGCLQAGSYPLWGLVYFRWWIVDRLMDVPAIHLLYGTNLYELWLRALGAKVGREVCIGSVILRVPDLLHVADRVSLGHGCMLENAKVQSGRLILGTIVIEEDATVDSYTVLEPNTRVGVASRVCAQSAVLMGHSVSAGRKAHGAPARDVGAAKTDRPRPPPVSSRGAALLRLRYAGSAFLISALFYLPVFPAFMLMDRIDLAEIWTFWASESVAALFFKYFILALPASALLVVATVVLASLTRKVFIPRLQPGRWPVHGREYFIQWAITLIQQTCLTVLRGIHATVYAGLWCRLLGASVGRDAEISTAVGFTPELLDLGAETFVADAAMLGDPLIDNGWMSLKRTRIADRTFVGNQAYVADGTDLPSEVLIGVLSTAPSSGVARSGQTWLGSPPLALPQREPTLGFPESLTFRPSTMRRVARGFTEALRIVVPQAYIVASGYVIVLSVMPLAESGDWPALVLALALCGLSFGVLSLLALAMLKWLLIGRYESRSAAMWTPFVWVSEAITNVYESLVVPSFVNYLRGTPWLPAVLRTLGCHIGAGVYLDSTDFTEFDCVHIGAHCELNGMALPQTHLFEDRVMKIDHVRIEDGVTMGARSIALYGSKVGEGACLGPLTLIMKGEQVGAGTSWQGVPAEPA